MPLTPSQVVRRWFEQVWNQGQESAIDELMAPHCVIHGLALPENSAASGPAAFKPFWQQFRKAFPDIHVEVLDCVSEGNRCVGHCRVTGTHTGDALGAATHAKIDFRGLTLAVCADGKIVEGWNYFDFLGMYRQMGKTELK